MWSNGICRYLETGGRTKYNRSIEEEFIHASISEFVTPAERDLNRNVSVLTEMQETGKVFKKTVHPVTRALIGPIGEAIERLLFHLKELRRNQTTISGHFINYLKFGRTHSDSPHVFLSARAPNRPMTGESVSNAVGQIIGASV